MFRTRAVRAVLLVGVIAASQLVATSAVKGGAPDVMLTFEPDPPVPFEPMTITAVFDGCAPGDQGQATVDVRQSVQDTVWHTPMAFGEATADDEGRVGIELVVASAYPGEWFVTVRCAEQDDALEAAFDVPVPSNFALHAQRSVLRRGGPFTLSMSGTGCVGGRARWEMAIPPGAFIAGGSAEPDVEGAWAMAAEGVIPTDWPRDSVGLSVWCTFADGVVVHYKLPSSLSTEVLPALIDDGDNDDPVVVGPRFTG